MVHNNTGLIFSDVRGQFSCAKEAEIIGLIERGFAQRRAVKNAHPTCTNCEKKSELKLPVPF